MANNWDATTFRNGDFIPQALSDSDWVKAGRDHKPVWCIYKNDLANGNKFGKLYNWYAVSDPRGLAPVGWHMPSDSEFTVLVNYLGGDKIAGKTMRNASDWAKRDMGNNSSGFSALPGFGRNEDGSFLFLGMFGYFWSSSKDSDGNAWVRFVKLYYPDLGRFSSSPIRGFSVRCVKD